MQKLILGTIAAFGAASGAGATTTVLTFNTNEIACTATDGGPATTACTTDGQLIGGNYGSSAALAVSYDSSEASGSRTSLVYTTDRFFTGNDGQAAPFSSGPADELSRIIFTPASGFEVSFVGFTWDKLTATTSADFIFKVFGPSNQELFSTGNGAQSYVVNTAYFTGPVTFAFGNGGRGAVAVDDIAVDVRPTAVDAVPEPASWALMISGFGLTGGILRRRTRVPAFA